MRWLLAVVIASGCVPTSFTYSPTFARGPAAKPQGCVFEVLTAPPTRGYDEVGILTFYNGTEPTTADQFKTIVAKQVCDVGGDAVIAIANARGQLTKGTVIHYPPGS
jgi:hypothetical protein